MPKMSFPAEEKPVGSGKPRSPSPPVRRSISTDRGALMRSRVKPDTIDNPSMMKLQFLARASVIKSVATIPVIPTTETNKKGYSGSQDNIYDAFSGLQKVKPRKIHSENEEDQFKQALNVRQGGIRKSKPESKVKAKHQLPSKVNLLSDGDSGGAVEEARKNDFSEPENDQGLVQSPTHGNSRPKKLHRNFSRNSQYVESREHAQALDSTLPGKNENKLPNNVLRHVKEGSTISSVPEFKRSRSSPRGKFMILP